MSAAVGAGDGAAAVIAGSDMVVAAGAFFVGFTA